MCGPVPVAEDPSVRRQRNPQRLFVKQRDFVGDGYALGCLKCEYAQKHSYAKSSHLRNSDDCRERIAQELKEILDGTRAI